MPDLSSVSNELRHYFPPNLLIDFISCSSITKQANKKYKVAILSIGTRLVESVLAARLLESQHPDLSVCVADARFMKPLDEQMIAQLGLHSDVLVTVEEGSKGGFGAHVLHYLSEAGLLELEQGQSVSTGAGGRSNSAVSAAIAVGGSGDFTATVIDSSATTRSRPRPLKIRTMHIPDVWIEAGPQRDQYDIAGLNQQHIVDKVAALVGSLRPYR